MMNKVFKGATIALAVAGCGFVLSSRDAQAMSVFARKYNVDCTMCHTIVPKLNKTGYEFRAAGYRMPDQIGENASENFKLGNFFSARIQAGYKYSSHNPDQGDSTDKSDLYFKEFTMYPLTGSWGKHFGSLTEISMAPGDSPEIENAYVRYVRGNQDAWFEARLGIMHAWEGFGGSDRTLSLSRPMFQTSYATVGKTGSSPFKLWSKDEMAAEFGYNLSKTGTFIAARISNGVTVEDPAQSAQSGTNGSGFHKGTEDAGHNDKNYALMVNQFINDDSAVSVYFYQGDGPYTNADPDNKDTYTRVAAYANFWAMPDKLNLLAGYGWGKDDLDYAPAAGVDTTDKSNGFFLEGDYHFSPTLAVAGRYDQWDPSDNYDDDKKWAVTLSGNVYTLDGLQLITDYRHVESDVAGGGTDKDDSIEARMIYIW